MLAARTSVLGAWAGAPGAWERVRFHSTQAGHLHLVRARHPQARVFEERDRTRSRLLRLRLGGECGEPPAAGTDWPSRLGAVAAAP